MAELILYMTGGCHLCEQARQVIYHALGQVVTEVDIAEDDVLMERYGIRIPVLRRSVDDGELNWPFSTVEVRRFCNTALMDIPGE